MKTDGTTAPTREGSMTTATRFGHVLTGVSFGAMTSVGLLALSIAESHPVMAQSNGPAALTGIVSSREEGKMEGVVVSAKRPGSTIMVSVSTDAQGQYSFPQDRLTSGTYDITIRAVGYTLKPTAATIQSGGPTQLDLSLAKAAPDVLALQMSNSEWMQSAPGTAGQKMAVLRCLDCHGLQRPFFSNKNASEMTYTLQRMTAHTANASPNFPFFLQNASEILSRPPTRGQSELGAYIASINLSSGETWPYKLKTQPRPTGKSTRAIVTTYDLPESAAPHDTLLDKAGNVWFSDFQHHVISKLDPKTGKVTRYPVPISKPGFPTGALMITMDGDGNIWEAMMGQAQIAKLDPRTEKVSIYLAPDWNKADTRFTMIDALHSKVDGKLWTKTNGGPEPDHANKLYQFDIATEKFHEVLPPAGKRDIAAYGLVTDLDNNVYGLDNNPDQRQIWRTNAKTGETTYIDLPLGVGGARRGHIDSHNRLWFSRFHANSYAMYDPETGHVTQWEVPVAFAGAYDVQFDEAGYAWGADMSTDLVQRLNVETGEWSSYLLPTSINTRHIDVQKSSNPNILSSMWTEGQQTSKIVHIEPLTP
jgi:virginiamycin B lyase